MDYNEAQNFKPKVILLDQNNKKNENFRYTEIKNSKTPFTTITAYDYPTAKIIDDLNIPLILVGDSHQWLSMDILILRHYNE